MLLDERQPARTKATRFRDFASTDLLVRHCFKECDGTERVVYEVGAIKRMASYLDWMERSVKRTAKDTTPPWRGRQHGGRYWWSTSKDAVDLWHVLRNVDEAPKELTDGRRLNPHLKLALHLAYKWEPRLRHFSNGSGRLDLREEYARRTISHIVRVIRRTCNSRRFRNLVNNDTRNAKDNYLSCAKCMLKVFRVHARPLVLRIDLYFESDAKLLSESRAARKAYNKFLRHLSERKILPDVLWYAGKRENGLERRIHFHVMVVLDGDRHQQGHSLTEQLGRFWVDKCVGSPFLSSYKNCWERRGEYKHNCLGRLHYTDEDMLLGLRAALEYICKEGSHILVGKGMGRNLRKGHAPNPPESGKRRGAPRKRGNHITAAVRVLLGGL